MTPAFEGPVERLRTSTAKLIQLLQAAADPQENDFAFIAEMAQDFLVKVEAGRADQDASLFMRGVSGLKSINKAVADNNGSDASSRRVGEAAFQVFKDAVEADRSIRDAREAP